MTRAVLVALLALAIVAPAGAAAGHADVIVVTTEAAPSSLGSGVSTATASLQNTTTSPISVTAAIGAQANCGVDVSPKQLDASATTDVTFLFDGACDLSKATTLTVTYAAGTTPAAGTIKVGAAPSGAEWGKVAWSYLIALGVAAGVALLVSLLIWLFDHQAPSSPLEPSSRAPTVTPGGPGPVPPGTYTYEVTHAARQTPRLPWFLKETGRSGSGGNVELATPSSVKVQLRKVGNVEVVERRIYRRTPNGTFRRVGKVGGRRPATFTDTWMPIRPGTPLTALGTNWSFQSNWIGNVTIGSTLLVALFASNDTLGSIAGPGSKPSLTAMAVAAAISAVFVGLGPLIIKLVGADMNVPTVTGTVLAAFVTLFGSMGQVAALTWLSFDLAHGNGWLQTGIAAIGAVFGLVVLWYAARALWFFLRTGAAFVPSAPSETLVAAALIARAVGPRTRSTPARRATGRAEFVEGDGMEHIESLTGDDMANIAAFVNAIPGAQRATPKQPALL